MLILKALDYPDEVAKEADANETVRKQIEADFPDECLLEPMTEAKWFCSPSKNADSSIIYRLFRYKNDEWHFNEIDSDYKAHKRIIYMLFRLKIAGAQALNAIQTRAVKSKFSQDVLKRVKAALNVEQPTIEDIKSYIRKLIQTRINKNVRPFQQRLERFNQVFHAKPHVYFNTQDKTNVQCPFGIVLASTKTKAVAHSSFQSEFTLRRAKVGVDFDVFFVPPANVAQVKQWAVANHLENLTVRSTDDLIRLTQVPLYHAPHQIISKPQDNRIDYPKLNDVLRTHVVPLYRASYPNGTNRIYHNVDHAMRVVLFTSSLEHLYAQAGHHVKSKSGDVQIAGGLHDCMRQNDGHDFWDAESGAKCSAVLQSVLGRTPEQARVLELSIAEKDNKQPNSLEQKLVHDADCLEIYRCLSKPEDFKYDELWIMKDLNRDLALTYIAEARRFIALMQKPELKNFINESKDPYRVLIQMLKAVEHHFPLLTSTVTDQISAFCEATEYLLTPEIEEILNRGC